MAGKDLIEAIAEILCTECDGTDFASLPETVKYLECRVDRTRAIADKDSARKIADVILAEVLAALQDHAKLADSPLISEWLGDSPIGVRGRQSAHDTL